MLNILTLKCQRKEVLTVFFIQTVLVTFTHKLARGIHEQNLVIYTRFFKHNDAGGNGGAKEKIRW